MKNYRLMVEKPNSITIQKSDIPPLQSREILVKTIFSGISHGTEIAIINNEVPAYIKKWDPDMRLYTEGKPTKGYPTPLGYENAGEVIKVGSGVKPSEFNVGDYVWMPVPHQTFTVADVDGAPILKLSGKADAKKSIFTALTRVALEGVHDGRIKIGDRVAVFGLGTVGLLTLKMAQLQSQTQIIGIDLLPIRQKAAGECGALAINPTECDVAVRIHELTDGQGVDVAIETSGTSKGLHEAIRSCRLGGRVVTVASYRGGAANLFLDEEWHRNRIEMVSSMSISGAVPRDYPLWNLERLNETALRIIEENRIEVESLITHEVPFMEAQKAYDIIQNSPNETIKVILTYEKV